MRATPLLPITVALALAAPGDAAKPAKAPAARPAATTHQTIDPVLAKAVSDPGRPEKDRARDRYRHPAQTLSFFGLKPDMTVVELFPGGGWYTAILAPAVAARGQYVAAVPPGKARESFGKVLAAGGTRYDKVRVVDAPGGVIAGVEPGSADMVLTFRNIHNMLGEADQPGDGTAPAAFASWFQALKPGGVLGVEEHRLPENMDVTREKTTGYVKRSTVIRLAMAAGFRLVAASDVNANPKDDHDHPKGVWTLPPTYAAGDEDKAKYTAIGESDRLTLKFVKPDMAAADAPAN